MKEWLSLNGVDRSVLPVIDQYCIDGDGILSLTENFYDLIRSGKNDKNLNLLVEILRSRKEDEIKKQISYLLPPQNVEEIFPPHIIPEDSFEALLYYHEQTKVL